MRKKEINKAEEIRKYDAKHPDARGIDVVAALDKKGITVTPQQVTNVRKAAAIKAGKVQLTGRVVPTTSMKTVMTGRITSKAPPVQDTDTIVKLAVVQDAAIKVGGLQQLETLAQTLGNLQIPGFTR